VRQDGNKGGFFGCFVFPLSFVLLLSLGWVDGVQVEDFAAALK